MHFFSPYPVSVRPAQVGASPAPLVFATKVPPSLLVSGTGIDWLTSEEEAALAVLGSAKRRAQFVAGRWLLRYAVRTALGLDVRYMVRLIDGRPVLMLGRSKAPMPVSISHCADLVLCGVMASGLLGVDVERVRPRRKWDELASFVLHPSERARLEGLPEPERWRCFYRVWTLKEALAKATGVGLALPFSQIATSDDGRIEAAPKAYGLADPGWCLADLSAGGDTAAAAAWRPASR